MSRTLVLRAVVLLLGSGVTLRSLSQESDFRSRISLNSRVGFNIRAHFSHLGGFPAQSNPGPATSGVDHFYDDGFNRVDVNGNSGGQTWFWGYQNASQLPGNDTIVMNSSSAPPTGEFKDVRDDPHWGAELSYFYVLDDNGAYRWGIEAAGGWMDLAFRERGSFATDVTRISDAYALNGVVPPSPPYAGTFNGPGPVIGDTPTRTVTTLSGAAITSGRYDLDAQAYSLRLGLRYESPFNDWLAFHFGAGFSGAFMDSEFSFQETTTVTGVGTLTRSATESETGFLAGAYVGAGITLHMTDRLTVFAGAQYEHLTRFTQETAGREAELDAQDAIFVTVGVGFGL